MTHYYAEYDAGSTGKGYMSAMLRDRRDGCNAPAVAEVRDLPTAILIANLLNTQEAK